MRQNTPNQFLNGPNYQKIVGFLRQHYAQKMGVTALPDRIDARLQKTVQHYMSELSRVQGVTQPIATMNNMIVRETSGSMDQWLRKQDSAPSMTAAPVTTTLGGSTMFKADEYNRLFEDTNTRYEHMMADRTPPSAFVPAVPDFRLSNTLSEDEGDVLAAMERIQKERDDQARSGPHLEIRDIQPHSLQLTPPQASPAPPPLAPRPQDYIIPQEDITKYQETEYNIFLTSSDRDWLRNTTETRYSFTVNFNTGMKKNGFSYSPALQERFRNIQRIEFVKAIVPTESLTTLVRVAENGGAGLRYDNSRVINVFSLPFVGVRIAELNNNGFSTKSEEDNTFALVQYDTTWSSDALSPSSHTTAPVPVLTKSGYTGLIPKFLKTQRVYTPTPLATLQRMSIRMERHSGDLLSDEPDVYSLKRICMSGAFDSIGTPATIYNVSPRAYIFIQTQKYFPHSAVGEGDTVIFQGITFSSTTAASSDFLSFLQRSAGHHVVATGHVNSAGALVDGRNEVGYCNVLILRNRFDDPSTGSVGRTGSYFGGSDVDEAAFAAALNTTEPAQTSSALLNQSRQTHIVLRIITRAVDSGANIRPDNV